VVNWAKNRPIYHTTKSLYFEFEVFLAHSTINQSAETMFAVKCDNQS
jgi:hypothetical protein